MKISELQRHLQELDVRPNKKLGQNFLVDDNVAQWIVNQLDVRPSDTIVEVGPGTGALTKHLVGRCRKLILIEKDRKLADELENHYSQHGWHFEVIRGDAAKYDIRPLFKEGKVKLLGNLPYSAATGILENFLDPPSPVEAAVIMIQKEVANRICAEPNTKAMGVLSAILQRRWTPTHLKTVGPALFYPRPEVDSTIIRLDPRDPGAWPLHCPETYAETVKKGFSQRRKQLHNNLGVDGAKWQAIAKSIHCNPQTRAENLTIRQWVSLSNHFDKHPAQNVPAIEEELFDVVDENDLFVERVSRIDVHKRNLRHRAVHVFLFNNEGELYLQKRSHLKDSHPGKWDSSASGHVDAGERYADAVIRELKEELFVRPRKELKLLAKLKAGPETDMEFIELYRCDYGGKIKTHTSEIDCGGFFPLEEVADWVDDRPHDFATGFVTCFRHFVIKCLSDQ
ncbi:MAG: ribosomal RNA small subunit methyltransferase A [Verrucomicrobiales bacterium]|nr:ribosomal RNA small subunit methyltransferase A [Verrucomicrobiales bacterium]